MRVLHHNRHARGGVTLVELLVVVTILMMLAAFAIPMVRPMTESRRIREAVRAIDVFFAQAKTRAIEIQRPVGVLLERMTQVNLGPDLDNPADDIVVYQDDACNVLRMVEVPAPYAGEFSNSRVRIQNQGISGDYLYLKLQISVNDFSNGLILEGDQIQFNYQGPYYTIVRDPAATPPDFELDPITGYYIFVKPDNNTYAADTLPSGNTDGWVDTHQLTVKILTGAVGAVPWSGTWSGGVPFQIARQPQASSTPPLRLPKNTVIDLGDSGYYIGLPDQIPATPKADGSDVYPTATEDVRYAFQIYEQTAAAYNREYKQFPDAFARIGDSGTPALDNRGPMILFAPNGAIQGIYHWKEDTLPTDPPSYAPYLVTRPVFLMVGKWERTGHLPITPGQRVDSLAEDGLHNWQDASNLWIAIGPHNGLVTAAEVYAPAVNTAGRSVPGDPNDTDPGNLGEQMQTSRTFARQAQISKGALDE